MNNSIRKLMRKRNRIHKKAVKTQNPHHWQKYRDLRNKVIAEIRASRDIFNKKLSEQIYKSIPPGKWWRIVKSLSKQKNKNKSTAPLKSSNHIFFHPMEKANVLNEHFASVSTINNEPGIPLHAPGPPNFLLDDFIITEQEVLDHLQVLNVTKPSGPDSMSPLVLRNIAKSIVKPLTKMYNYSLTIGQLPDIWKNSQITPIFKNKGSAHDVNNYRPISITSVVCKI